MCYSYKWQCLLSHHAHVQWGTMGATKLTSLLHRIHSVNAPSQWETALQCNAIFHWLGAYINYSLHDLAFLGPITMYLYHEWRNIWIDLCNHYFVQVISNPEIDILYFSINWYISVFLFHRYDGGVEWIHISVCIYTCLDISSPKLKRKTFTNCVL